MTRRLQHRRTVASSPRRDRFRRPPLRLPPVVLALALFLGAPARAQQAPDFTLKDLSGREWSLKAAFPGKVILLDFWATWCVPCIKELPHLQRLQDVYGEKGLQVVTISTDGPDKVADVSAFAARYGLSLPVLLDTDSRVVSIYNPSLALPHSVLIDRRGVVRHVHQGYSPGDERGLEERIVSLLGEDRGEAARSLSVQVAHSLLLRLPRNGSDGTDGEHYTEHLEQLEVTVARGSLLLGTRFDPSLDLSPVHGDLRLAKRYAQYAGKRVQARAGDFYTSLGRGLVFSVRKLFEKESIDYVIDTTVDGGQASLVAGRVSGNVFGGWIDRPDDRSVKDRVAGFSAGAAWPGVATVRVQGVGAQLQPGAEFSNRRVATGSISVEVPELAGAAALYGEVSLMRRRTYTAAAPVDGHGLYLGSKLHAGRFSVLLELKKYKELDFEFARPPLLESEELDIVADQFDLDRTDVRGYSARLDYTEPTTKTLLYGKYLRVDDTPKTHRLYGAYDRGIDHVLGGLERRFPGGGYLHALAGWRRDSATPDYFPSEGQTIHEQFNVSWPLGEGWSVEGDWKHKAFDGVSYRYSEIRTALALHRSPRWVLSGLYERTTDPAIVYYSGQRNYGAGQLEVRFGEGRSLRFFAGSTKGSMRCAGGVCRLFPAFEGVRLDAFLRF